jgi:NADPH:quinone reductase-like Zn-dependent oxidoreductase
VEKPTPKDNEILVKVRASTVVAGDCEMRSFKLPLLFWIPARLYLGVLTPGNKILGQEFAGEVEHVGKDVTQFKTGDQVFGLADLGAGAYAEYLCRPSISNEGLLDFKPTNLTYEEAAAVPVGAFEALHFLKAAHIKPGEKVLVNGAGGSIGTFAVQLAKYYGAEVTAVDRGDKLDMLRSIGADHVTDYTREKFTRNGKTYDVIFDVVSKSVISGGLRSLSPNGRYVLVNFSVFALLHGRWLSRTSSKTIITGISSRTLEDLKFIKGLLETKALKPVIDRRYPLEKVAEAHHYVEGGHKKGSVVITVGA